MPSPVGSTRAAVETRPRPRANSAAIARRIVRVERAEIHASTFSQTISSCSTCMPDALVEMRRARRVLRVDTERDAPQPAPLELAEAVQEERLGRSRARATPGGRRGRRRSRRLIVQVVPDHRRDLVAVPDQEPERRVVVRLRELPLPPLLERRGWCSQWSANASSSAAWNSAALLGRERLDVEDPTGRTRLRRTRRRGRSPCPRSGAPRDSRGSRSAAALPESGCERPLWIALRRPSVRRRVPRCAR